MFMETIEGSMVRVEDIVEGTPDARREFVALRLHNGDQRTATWSQWRTGVRCSTWQFAAAEPDTYLLYYGDTEGCFWAGRERVLGWVLDCFGDIEPVTANGIVLHREYPWTVLLSDGRVQDLCTQWDTYADWESDMRTDLEPKSKDRPAGKQMFGW